MSFYFCEHFTINFVNGAHVMQGNMIIPNKASNALILSDALFPKDFAEKRNTLH